MINEENTLIKWKLAYIKILTYTNQCCKCFICCILLTWLVISVWSQLCVNYLQFLKQCKSFYSSAHYFNSVALLSTILPSVWLFRLALQRSALSVLALLSTLFAMIALLHTHTHTLHAIAHTHAYIVALTCRKKLLLTHRVSAWWLRAQERERGRETEGDWELQASEITVGSGAF